MRWLSKLLGQRKAVPMESQEITRPEAPTSQLPARKSKEKSAAQVGKSPKPAQKKRSTPAPARAGSEPKTAVTLLSETIVENQRLFDGPRAAQNLDLFRELVNTGFSEASILKALNYPDPRVRAVARNFLRKAGRLPAKRG